LIELIMGSLRVIRYWRPPYLGHDNLRSVGKSHFWMCPEETAKCLGRNKHHEPAPKLECTCGLYAYYNRTGLLYPIAGVVEASGKIILGTKGIRAEKMKIIAMCRAQNRTGCDCSDCYVEERRLQRVVRKYVPPERFFSNTREMLTAYPLDDVTDLLKQRVEPEYQEDFGVIS
jgi:hypothetical protein